MRAIYLTDQDKRDSAVAIEPVIQPSEVSFVLEGGDPVHTVKVIKNTFDSHLGALEQKAAEQKKTIEDLLVEGDPEIDYNYTGKISSKTKTIYLNNENKISYNLRFKENIFAPDGSTNGPQDYQREPSNISADFPLHWSGRFLPLKKVVGMVAFSKIYQLRHTNGLTFDFLYKMAAMLEKKKAFMMLGAGPNGKQPLRLTRGSLPYRAFLRGRTQADAYCLTLHLANLELKDFS